MVTLLDFSRAFIFTSRAAQKIDMIKEGKVKVQVDVVELGKK
jgi:rare lipoprotein A (peptidoglycan hydrolase)